MAARWLFDVWQLDLRQSSLGCESKDEAVAQGIQALKNLNSNYLRQVNSTLATVKKNTDQIKKISELKVKDIKVRDAARPSGDPDIDFVFNRLSHRLSQREGAFTGGGAYTVGTGSSSIGATEYTYIRPVAGVAE